MTGNFEEFQQIVDAEDYFKFFDLPYEQTVVNVNRLHILSQFSKYIQEIDEKNPDLNQSDKLAQYHAALEKAYQVFIESTPQQEKLFKVFKKKPKNVVTLTELTSD